ncbi:MAG: ABC transporter permease, partial [Candidatus Binatia bacterium]
MKRVFRHLSLRHFAAHRLRTLFTVAGIALGVATIVGMRLMHESVSRGYERTIERIAGKAVMQVTNGEVGVPEELLEEIRRVPGVSAAVASVQGFVSVPGGRGERLYVFGVDLLADDELREYEVTTSEAEVDDPLVFLAQPDSVALTRPFLERSALRLEDTIDVLAPQGKARLTIRGALDVRSGPASLFGGRLAVMDVFAAQQLFQLGRRFSQIDIG